MNKEEQKRKMMIYDKLGYTIRNNQRKMPSGMYDKIMTIMDKILWIETKFNKTPESKKAWGND